MKIAVPVETDLGLESPVYGHFGSAPYFALIQTDDASFEMVSNGNAEHVHGACHPAQGLMRHKVDGVLVGGIGRNALMGLLAAGIRVYQSSSATLGEAMRAVRAGELDEFSPQAVCGAHGGGCGCYHG
jgi:predicted Fe-Mo cluster-binding NifX family protein